MEYFLRPTLSDFPSREKSFSDQSIIDYETRRNYDPALLDPSEID